MCDLHPLSKVMNSNLILFCMAVIYLKKYVGPIVSYIDSHIGGIITQGLALH